MYKKNLVVSYERLALAFMDVMDGNTWKDVSILTGLSDERCKDIYNIYSELSDGNSYDKIKDDKN